MRAQQPPQDEIELAESGVDVSGMVLPLTLTAHHARCSASCSAHRRHGSLCTYSNQLCTRFAHAAPPDRPSPPPPCFSRIRPWLISRFAASRGPCCHRSTCFRGAFGIHAQVSKLWEATTASILRVLVGCTHVLWLALYMVTNSVLWMSPRATPCDLAPRMVGGHAIGSAWHDMAAGDGHAGICHACLVALVQNMVLVESEKWVFVCVVCANGL